SLEDTGYRVITKNKQLILKHRSSVLKSVIKITTLPRQIRVKRSEKIRMEKGSSIHKNAKFQSSFDSSNSDESFIKFMEPVLDTLQQKRYVIEMDLDLNGKTDFYLAPKFKSVQSSNNQMTLTAIPDLNPDLDLEVTYQDYYVYPNSTFSPSFSDIIIRPNQYRMKDAASDSILTSIKISHENENISLTLVFKNQEAIKINSHFNWQESI
ncbi:hypothetical protein MJH12_05605, partial [bacterium]|nr:hypothetical protein [bacterium]